MKYQLNGITIELSDRLCELYKQFTCLDLTPEDCVFFLEGYYRVSSLQSLSLNQKEMEHAVTTMVAKTICSNMGEEVEDAICFLKQKGYM